MVSVEPTGVELVIQPALMKLALMLRRLLTAAPVDVAMNRVVSSKIGVAVARSVAFSKLLCAALKLKVAPLASIVIPDMKSFVRSIVAALPTAIVSPLEGMKPLTQLTGSFASLGSTCELSPPIHVHIVMRPPSPSIILISKDQFGSR